ncbi:hypothetical protein N431DRAFT_431296 [Stipitochalara longipes BDJ]|nr:hypothetical protein N431DRAFT_431296 [Stipitochalara longipes BDJ]
MSKTNDTTLHARAKKRHLPMLLNSKLVDDVCADSGSDINCMTEAFAKKIGARMTQDATLQWFSLPIKGKSFQSLGTVSIGCRFPSEISTIPSVCFFVFKKLICNVIVGRNFLRDTQTLDLYQTRLRIAETQGIESPAIRSVGNVREQIKCWIDGITHWSFPDTGSDLNLISTGFAKCLGYGSTPGDKQINLVERHWVDFADCSSVRTEGSIQIVVSFCPPTECHSSPHKLVGTLKESASIFGTGVLGKQTSIVEPFHIIDDLDFDIILGETLLASVAAYTQHKPNFTRSEAPDTSATAICKKRCPKEGKTHTGPLLTPEQRFRDDFSIEYDRWTKEQEDIENKRLRGQVAATEGTIIQDQVKQRHIQWLREHRELLELHYPGYFEKIAPQEVGWYTRRLCVCYALQICNRKLVLKHE